MKIIEFGYFLSLFFQIMAKYFYSLVQAAKILANLIVMGGGILARAFVQAYRQALASKCFVEISPHKGYT